MILVLLVHKDFDSNGGKIHRNPSNPEFRGCFDRFREALREVAVCALVSYLSREQWAIHPFPIKSALPHAQKALIRGCIPNQALPSQSDQHHYAFSEVVHPLGATHCVDFRRERTKDRDNAGLLLILRSPEKHTLEFPSYHEATYVVR